MVVTDLNSKMNMSQKILYHTFEIFSDWDNIVECNSTNKQTDVVHDKDLYTTACQCLLLQTKSDF